MSKKMKIQSLILLKTKFKSLADAQKWATDHDYKSDVDETDASYRFRQQDTEDFVLSSFRTIDFGPGIKAVVGKNMKEQTLERQYTGMLNVCLDVVNRDEPAAEGEEGKKVIVLNEDVELDENKLPKRIRMFKIGDNPTAKGIIVYDPDDAEELKAGQNGQEHLAFDVAHGTMHTDAPPEAHGAVGWFNCTYEDTGVWANLEEWLEFGRDAILGRKFRYISPAINGVEMEDGRILLTGILSCTLTNIPATTNASPLFNDRRVQNMSAKKTNTESSTTVELAAPGPVVGKQPKMDPSETDESGVRPSGFVGKLEDDAVVAEDDDNEDTSPVAPALKTPDQMSPEELSKALEEALEENTMLRKQLEETRAGLDEATKMYEAKVLEEDEDEEEEEDEETKERREIMAKLSKADKVSPTQCLVLSRMSMDGLRKHADKALGTKTIATPAKKVTAELEGARVNELQVNADIDMVLLEKHGLAHKPAERLALLQGTLGFSGGKAN